MRPLLWIAWGLLIVGVKAKFGRWDALVDPVGWLVVLVGVRRLANAVDLPLKMGLTCFGLIALACSVPLWLPDTARRLERGDPSALWAVGLGELLFQVLLTHALATRAQAARASVAAIWFRVCEVGLLVGVVAPPLYFGGGQGWLDGVGDWGLVLQPVVFLLCFWYSGREWAGAEPRAAIADETENTRPAGGPAATEE